jgi:hypothetical protein
MPNYKDSGSWFSSQRRTTPLRVSVRDFLQTSMPSVISFNRLQLPKARQLCKKWTWARLNCQALLIIFDDYHITDGVGQIAAFLRLSGSWRNIFQPAFYSHVCGNCSFHNTQVSGSNTIIHFVWLIWWMYLLFLFNNII